MRKKIFLLLFAMATVACMLAFSVSAETITDNNGLSVALTSGINGEYDIFGDLSDGTQTAIEINKASEVVFNLTGDTVIDDNITFNADARVVFNLNGYTLTCTRSASGVENQGFFLTKTQSCVIEINGRIENDGTIKSSVYSKDLLIYAKGGTLSCTNVNVSSGEEFVFARNTGLSTSIQLDGGIYTVRSNDQFISCVNIGNNTYFKNCTLVASNKTISIDDNCSNEYRNAVYGGTSYDIVFENVDMAGFSVNSSTSLQNFIFKDLVNNLDSDKNNDLTIDKVKLGQDRHYNNDKIIPYAKVINSPTCIKEGFEVSKTLIEATPVTVTLEKAPHTLSNKIVGVAYDNGFLSSGAYKCEFSVEGCDALLDGDSVNALFKFLGYSTPEDGSYGLVASFIVDREAIDVYENLTDKTLTYGIVACGMLNLGDKTPLDKNGNPVILESGSVIKAGVDKKMVGYDFILTGLNENQLDTELVIATYVEISDENGMEIVYLQNTQKTSSLDVISYNTVK